MTAAASLYAAELAIVSCLTQLTCRVFRRSLLLGAPPGAGNELDVLVAQRLRALRHERGDHLLAVALSPQKRRRLLADVLVAPLAQAGEGQVEVAALRRQVVL